MNGQVDKVSGANVEVKSGEGAVLATTGIITKPSAAQQAAAAFVETSATSLDASEEVKDVNGKVMSHSDKARKEGLAALLDEDFGEEEKIRVLEKGEDSALDADLSDQDVGGISVDDLLDETAQGDEAGIVEVYHEKCLRCNHLVAFAEKTFWKCHYTRGNANCPAQSLKITIQMDLGPTVRKFLRHEQEKDSLALALFYQKLAEKDPWIQKEIMAAIEKGRQESAVSV
jgi:hypothetical protein